MSLQERALDAHTIDRYRHRLAGVYAFLAEDLWFTLGVLIVFAFILLGLFGPYLAPYDPIADYVRQEGQTVRLAEPSFMAPMGTTQYGRDVFSQFIAGTRPTMIAGIAGFLSGLLGFLVGLTAGYFEGWTDEVLMRITDLSFSIPAFPLALVILDVLEPRIWLIFLVLLILLWRLSARVVRSEVLTVKERTFVKSARVSGAGHFHLMFRTIAPNVVPIGLLYSTYDFALAISFQAGLAFLGYGDPTSTSWGQMIREVYGSGFMREAWWWLLPPALGIAVVTVTVFFVGRKYEEILNPEI
ncbi:MAG: ABC transporter permease [Halobacteriales archaeon]|nr:ABC transporter permease [Halobacteriales archaeon]